MPKFEEGILNRNSGIRDPLKNALTMGLNIAGLKDMKSALEIDLLLNESLKSCCCQAGIFPAPHRKHHDINNKNDEIYERWMLVDDTSLGDLCLTLIPPCVSYRQLVRLKICLSTGG